MKIARITGTVTATAKDAQLTGHKLMLCDIIDGAGKLLVPAVVAADTCGAGVGDTVMIVTGSGARLPAGLAGVPIDASIVAIVEHITISKQK